MRKLILIVIILALTFTSISSIAEEWICPNCGKANITNFCTSCGTKHESWICPDCGTENDNAFCGNCGKQKPTDGTLATSPTGKETETDEKTWFTTMNGHSMENTIQNGDMLFFKQISSSSISPFSIVAVNYPGRDGYFIKRLIGMPGDTVELREGYLYINGEKYDEPYISDEYRSGPLNTFSAFRVPAKGDPLVCDGNTLKVNGESWRWSDSRLSGTAANGDKLQYYYDFTNNKQVLKLNGKAIESAEELAAISGVEFGLDGDYYFVMGDHRNNSNDSRSQGPLEDEMILGVAIGTY